MGLDTEVGRGGAGGLRGGGVNTDGLLLSSLGYRHIQARKGLGVWRGTGGRLEDWKETGGLVVLEGWRGRMNWAPTCQSAVFPSPSQSPNLFPCRVKTILFTLAKTPAGLMMPRSKEQGARSGQELFPCLPDSGHLAGVAPLPDRHSTVLAAAGGEGQMEEVV